MKNILTILTYILLGVSFSANADDVAAGKAKAVTCAACHGQAGISPNPEWPNLAGQQEVYLKNQIKAFRDGKRTDPLMTPMVAGLSDTDVDNLAAYFAGLK